MIRVLIEWHCLPDKEAEMDGLLVELRAGAMRQRGYIFGETMRSADDPSLWLVISTWLDIDLWRAWETSPARQAIVGRIEPLRLTPPKVSAFGFVWETNWWPQDTGHYAMDEPAHPAKDL